MNRKRYFQENGDKEKYPVGQLSPALRRALQLEDDMLPFWIYRMRILGYPPAWMKEAEMSTLNVIDLPGTSTQKKDKNPFAVSEEGEIKDTASQYNKESLIEFPGFNAPIPDNVKDDWLILGMPPLIMKQQLSEAVKSMKFIEPIPYKKSKLDSSTTKDDSEAEEASEANANDESQDGEIIDLTEDENGSMNETSINAQSEDKTEIPISERKLNMISMGTPVPESIKPKLPSLDKWAIGMGELIYFENLPTSTGAYKDKMKGILDKIRDRQSKNE